MKFWAESQNPIVSVSGAKKVPAITLLRHTWLATVHCVGGPWVVASPSRQLEPQLEEFQPCYSKEDTKPNELVIFKCNNSLCNLRTNKRLTNIDVFCENVIYFY